MAGPEEYTQHISCKLLTMGLQHCTTLFILSYQNELQCLLQNIFQPVAGQEEALADGSRICTRLMSISEMSAFQNMSHEV